MSLIEEERIVALAHFLKVHPDTITHEGDDRYSCSEQAGEWLYVDEHGCKTWVYIYRVQLSYSVTVASQ